MASSKEATAQNGETVVGKVKIEGEALKEAIKKQVFLFLGRFSVFVLLVFRCDYILPHVRCSVILFCLRCAFFPLLKPHPFNTPNPINIAASS